MKTQITSETPPSIYKMCVGIAAYIMLSTGMESCPTGRLNDDSQVLIAKDFGLYDKLNYQTLFIHNCRLKMTSQTSMKI